MAVEERTDLLKFNIARHMKDLLGLDFIEIRLLDRATNRLIPLLTEGMTPLAANRELYARKEGNGVTGFVAATGLSYVCPDTTKDPLYLEGAAGSRSSLTVPLIIHGTVIGTLNVESPQPERVRRPRPAVHRDLRPQHRRGPEHARAAPGREGQHGQRLGRGDQPRAGPAAGRHHHRCDHGPRPLRGPRRRHHRPAAASALPAREIRSLIHKAGSTVVPQPKQSLAAPAPRLGGTRLLVVDADEAIRRSAHHLLGCQGASVETARDAHEAIALMRQAPYSAALVDIRLPDLDGYETFKRLREVQPNVPIILMTGFGWDPSHSIVKARQEGLQTVLYKPFRADRLMEAVEQALRHRTGRPFCLRRAATTERPHAGPAVQTTPPRRLRPVSAADSPPPAAAVSPTQRRNPSPPARNRSRHRTMSPDWPWPVILALVVPPALGHLYHFVLVINVGSGLGFRESLMDRVADRSCSRASGSRSALLLWKHLHDPWWTWSWPLRSYAFLCVVSGIVFWPLFSWRLARRRRPEGITGSSRTVDLARSRGTAPLIGGGRRSWLLRLPGNQSFRLCLREWDVTVPGLPARLDGLSIVQLSDFHLAPCFERLFFESVLDACLPWQSRPGRRHRRPGRRRRDDRLDRAAARSARRRGWASLRSWAITTASTSPAAIVRELGRAGFETLEGRWTTHRGRGDDIGGGRNVRTLGAGLRSPRRAAGRFPHPLEPFARSVLQGPGLGNRPDVRGAQPWWPDPAPLGRSRLHAQPLLAPVRPRVLPPRRDAPVRQRGRGRQTPGSLRLPAGNRPVRAPCRDRSPRTGRYHRSPRKREAMEPDWAQG